MWKRRKVGKETKKQKAKECYRMKTKTKTNKKFINICINNNRNTNVDNNTFEHYLP